MPRVTPPAFDRPLYPATCPPFTEWDEAVDGAPKRLDPVTLEVLPPDRWPKWDARGVLNVTPKTCLRCGKLFYPTTSNQKYCSEECRKQKYEKVCPICGKTFYTESKNRIYCSPQCYGKTRRSKEIKVCPICGKVFSPTSKGQICCSRSCGQRYRVNGEVHKDA